jgi:hypothetical protein
VYVVVPPAASASVTLILIVYPFPTADLSETKSGSLATIAVTTSCIFFSAAADFPTLPAS